MRMIREEMAGPEYVKLPILTYHRILLEEKIRTIPLKKDRIYTFASHKFQAHCNFLRSKRYSTICFKDFKNAINNKAKLPPKPIILSFDDGREDNYFDAFPLLREYGLKATFFIVTNYAGKEGYLNWDQIKEMHQNGMEFQSHTHTHCNLARLDASAIHRELTLSKALIEKHLNEEIFVLALPYGRGSKAVKKRALSAGYAFVCTSEWGYNKVKSSMFFLKRLPIKIGYEFKQFQSFVELRKSLLFYRARKMPVILARRAMGKALYESIRSRLLGGE